MDKQSQKISVWVKRKGPKLGKLILLGFGAGAITSALLAFSLRSPRSWDIASINGSSIASGWDAAASKLKSVRWNSVQWDAVEWRSLRFNSIAADLNATAIANLQLANAGLVVDETNVPGIEAFPREVSASHLCLPSEESKQGGDDAASTTGEGDTEALLSPILNRIQLGVHPDLVRQLAAPPWPDLHETASVARVPILMYHDVLDEKEVFFDVTVEELEAHFERIKEEGATPITFDQLALHLRTGAALPPKPLLLTFDDGYEGHYTRVYPLLQKYQYPAVFSIFTGKMDGEVAGRSTITWEQAQELANDPLITIAAHSITHPEDLRTLDDSDLRQEVFESKARLESKLGIPIRYFTYPTGYYDERVAETVADAGFEAALTMSNYESWFAGESDSMLAIGRFGQSELEDVVPEAWEGLALPVVAAGTFDFDSPIRAMRRLETEEVPLALITGGRPATIHADSRYQLEEILARSNAIAAVDGAFFSLEYLDSNVMIGPVLSQATQTFVPGNAGENPLLNGRPLALIGPDAVKFVPFDANQHNTLQGLQAEMTNVTDAFVGAGWLVRDGKPQNARSFGNLFDYDAYRHRAFWGINKAGQPVVGVTKGRVDSVTLGEVLQEVGFREAMMVDSGASTSLAYKEESLVDYTPRPVPHLIALMSPETAQGACPLTFEDEPDYDDGWESSYQ